MKVIQLAMYQTNADRVQNKEQFEQVLIKANKIINKITGLRKYIGR